MATKTMNTRGTDRTGSSRSFDAIARNKMKDYKLGETKLIVLQGMNNEAVDISSSELW